MLGYKLNVFEVKPKNIVYEDELQIVYTDGDKVQIEKLEDNKKTIDILPYTSLRQFFTDKLNKDFSKHFEGTYNISRVLCGAPKI